MNFIQELQVVQIGYFYPIQNDTFHDVISLPLTFVGT